MILNGRKIDLRLVTIDDAEFIMSMRLDGRKSMYLSKVDDDLSKQVEWLKRYKKREESGEEYYFIIADKTGEEYGCVRLYDFRNGSFCWGSWILKDGSPSNMAIESALMVYEYAFYKLGFLRSHFDVRKQNEKVVAFHQRLGAKIISEDDLNYYFNYTVEEYVLIKSKYSKYLPC